MHIFPGEGFSLRGYYFEVGTGHYHEGLYGKLNDLRNKDGLPIDIHELSGDSRYRIRCVYNNLKEKQNKSLTIRIYNYYFARALAETVFQSWEEVFIKKTLKKDYNMTAQDIKLIYPKTWDYLNDGDHAYLYQLRKRVLIKSILEFLDWHQRIDLDGFMDFRAAQYKRELKKQIARAVNAYALEQEHDSFVRLLKRFFKSQHMEHRILHMVMDHRGGVHFYDDGKKNIDKEYGDLSENIIDNCESYEDVLIGILLKCAPQKLVVHTDTKRQDGMLTIIEEVFGERMTYCEGCSLCAEN